MSFTFRMTGQNSRIFVGCFLLAMLFGCATETVDKIELLGSQKLSIVANLVKYPGGDGGPSYLTSYTLKTGWFKKWSEEDLNKLLHGSKSPCSSFYKISDFRGLPDQSLLLILSTHRYSNIKECSDSYVVHAWVEGGDLNFQRLSFKPRHDSQDYNMRYFDGTKEDWFNPRQYPDKERWRGVLKAISRPADPWVWVHTDTEPGRREDSDIIAIDLRTLRQINLGIGEVQSVSNEPSEEERVVLIYESGTANGRSGHERYRAVQLGTGSVLDSVSLPPSCFRLVGEKAISDAKAWQSIVDEDTAVTERLLAEGEDNIKRILKDPNTPHEIREEALRISVLNNGRKRKDVDRNAGVRYATVTELSPQKTIVSWDASKQRLSVALSDQLARKSICEN